VFLVVLFNWILTYQNSFNSLTEEMCNTATNSGIQLVIIQKLVEEVLTDVVEPVYQCDNQLVLFIKWFEAHHDSEKVRNKELKKLKSSSERRMSTMHRNIEILLYGDKEHTRMLELFKAKRVAGKAQRAVASVAAAPGEASITNTANVDTDEEESDDEAVGTTSDNTLRFESNDIAETSESSRFSAVKTSKVSKGDGCEEWSDNSNSDEEGNADENFTKLDYGPFGTVFLSECFSN
jgi:hypothetical protein